MKLVEGENAKWCGKCLNLKSFDEFVKNKNGSCGLDFSCIECNKVYRRSKIEYKTRKIYAFLEINYYNINTARDVENTNLGTNLIKRIKAFTVKRVIVEFVKLNITKSTRKTM